MGRGGVFIHYSQSITHAITSVFCTLALLHVNVVSRYGERYTKLLIRVKPPASPQPQPQEQQPLEEVNSSHRPVTPFSRFQRTISRQTQRLLSRTPWRRLRSAASREEVNTSGETPVQLVQAAVLHHFSERIIDQDLIDTQKDSITFQLPKNSVPLSEIFKVMEDLHRDPSLEIVGYSVSQSTLNQVIHTITHGYNGMHRCLLPLHNVITTGITTSSPFIM